MSLLIELCLCHINSWTLICSKTNLIKCRRYLIFNCRHQFQLSELTRLCLALCWTTRLRGSVGACWTWSGGYRTSPLSLSGADSRYRRDAEPREWGARWARAGPGAAGSGPAGRVGVSQEHARRRATPADRGRGQQRWAPSRNGHPPVILLGWYSLIFSAEHILYIYIDIYIYIKYIYIIIYIYIYIVLQLHNKWCWKN